MDKKQNAVSNIATALSKFQGETIIMELDNIEGDIKYCDMHVLGEKVAPLLAKHNLSIFVFFESLPNENLVKIRLYHQSGEMFESSLPAHDNIKIDDLNHLLRMAIGGLVGVIETDHNKE